MMDSPKKKRIKIRLKNPNPLFEKWLQKWYEEAKSKDSKSKFNFKQALDSLRKFPLPLASGKDCAILRGFGTKICSMIDKELLELNYSRGISSEIVYNQNIQNAVKSYQSSAVQNGVKSYPETIVQDPCNTKTNQIEIDEIQAEGEEEEQILMSPGTFKIILLVDTQETNGKSNKTLSDTKRFVESYKINYEVRRLSVGDFLWICRDENNHELVLPYIVERKRMDDFAGSIRDGRFHEQKFRLRTSGITNLIYLIEDYGKNVHVSLPMPTLMQAAVNTQVHNNFKIKFTESHRESISYLNVLTKIFIKQFKNKVLIGINKEDVQPTDINNRIFGLMKMQQLQENSVKNKAARVKEVFVKQLVQLKSLSVEIALAITEIYPTPRSLIDSYKRTESIEEAEQLLSDIKVGKLKHRLGIPLSKTIYNLYNTNF